MTHAYLEIYLNRAMSNLGDAFDYAINDCGIANNTFVDIFCNSIVCRKLENGEPKYLVGMSGVELAIACIEEQTDIRNQVIPSVSYDRSPEYWCGWAICFYQWYSKMSYKEIFSMVSIEDLLRMYPTLHEADITKFVEIMDLRSERQSEITKLKRFRKAKGLSQSGLSALSDDSHRSIQMYEKRKKDINKASDVTMLRLSKVLGCRIEDLIEAI
ncbi:MAG: helix-turn-helix transcriptional regulator [Phascolarctobacterium sp.]|nr:helix-turn-helix transcriptional regulator [Phascolarctobacterium sp.]